MIKLIYPEDGAILNTHTDLQDGFISRVRGEGIEMALEWLMSKERFHLYLTWRENILYNKSNSKKGALL